MNQKHTRAPRIEVAHMQKRISDVWNSCVPALGFALLVLFAAGATGCGGARNGNDAENRGQAMFRTPHPTFTPTPPAAAADASAALPSAPGPANSETSSEQTASTSVTNRTVDDPPRAVVSSPLVNLRSEPSLDSEVVATVERGAEFEIVGRSGDAEWWQVCCREGQAVWIARTLVDTDGAVDSIPATDSPATSSVAVDSGAEPGAAGQGGGGADQARFQLIAKEQFPESNVVRVYLYVYDDENALAGYRIRVNKDGREMPSGAQSFGGQPAFTWPFQDARQRFQNLKVEFPGEPPAGIWTVQLIDSQGIPVGPSAEFSLGDNEPNQELYVRYERSN
jgi:hypothetical protein